MYFTRLNRYRFNSYNNKQCINHLIIVLKFFKLKYPIAVGVFVTIAYDYTFRMYTNPPIEH